MKLAKEGGSEIRLGIVGHRFLASSETVSFVARESTAILKRALSQYENVTALSAIAEGADTIFAEAALALGIGLEIVTPFDEYASDFETASSRARYETLRVAARSEERLDFTKRSNEAYRAAMNWIVARSDILLIAWDGLPAEGLGGTGDAVKQAIELKKNWFHLDVTDLSVRAHGAGAKPCSQEIR